MNRANEVLWTAIMAFLANGCVAPAPAGTISGAIRAKDGAAKIPVEARPLEDPKGKVVQTVTDDAGRYRLEAVPPGRYEILAGPEATPTYYPDAKTSAHARAIALDPGAAVTGIDFALGGAHVRGRVRGLIPNGIPAGLLRVEMFSQDERLVLSRTAGDAPVQSDGTFEFLNVSPGQKEFTAPLLPGNYVGKPVESDVDIELVDWTWEERNGVQERLPSVSWLFGRATIEGAARFPANPDMLKPFLRLEARDAQGRFSTQFVRADGTFRFPSLPDGEYDIRLTVTPPGYTLKSISYEGADLLQSRLKVVSGMRFGFIEVVLTPPPAPGGNRTATLIVSKSGMGPGYTEGKLTFFRVLNGVREERRLGGEWCHSDRLSPTSRATGICQLKQPQNFDSLPFELPPGRYEARSYVRPCNGGCPMMGQPTDECSHPVTLQEGETVYVERVEQGHSCMLKVSSTPFR
jgi:hypothetical protein